MTIQVRLATAADAPAIAGVGRRSFAAAFAHLFPPQGLDAYLERTYGEAKISASLGKPVNRYWVATFAGALQAFVKLKDPSVCPYWPRPGACQLQKMYADPEWIGRGLGSALMAVVLAEAGHRDLWLQVHAGNHGARRLYQRHGFSNRCDQVCWIEGVEIPFFVMAREPGSAGTDTGVRNAVGDKASADTGG